jgi:hypothetical protein
MGSPEGAQRDIEQAADQEGEGHDQATMVAPSSCLVP